MYTAKISDNPSEEVRELASKALQTIAESRDSNALRLFLSTGELGEAEPELDVAGACRLLQIPDENTDETSVLAAFSVCCGDAPERIDYYRRALEVIGRKKRSALLCATAGTDAMVMPRDAVVGAAAVPGGPGDSGAAAETDNGIVVDWPVGLRNIGNTCYLNSLLQFYFTITPFREKILNWENSLMPLDEESLAMKKIGSRHISLNEVVRSQKCMSHLYTSSHVPLTHANSLENKLKGEQSSRNSRSYFTR